MYIHHPNCNFDPYDGYFDGVTHNFIHMEVGLAKTYGDYPRVFYQWNRTPTGFVDWYQEEVTYLPSTSYYVNFEISNIDMDNDSWDTWKLSYNGNLMTYVYMPLIYGKALCSSERLYVDSPGDDNRSSFRDLRKKDANGNWSLWTNSQVIAQSDPYYTWGSYSTSHWYSYAW